MGFMRHLVACNRFDPDRFRPLVLDRVRVGLIRVDRLEALESFSWLFTVGRHEVSFAPRTPRGADLTEALADITASLAAQGLITGLRGERFAVGSPPGRPGLFELDRGAVPFFGTRSYGVHVNGLVGDEVWVATRSTAKKVAPGKLDNLVAGGIGAGYGPAETVVKEAGEEAGLDPSLARQARPAGAIAYRMGVPEGVRDDVLFVFDLDLPETVQPVPVDGECASFARHRLDDVLRIVSGTDDFKFNVNLVLIDLAVRRGLIGPDHADYLALIHALHGGLIREPS
jgi:8-oxo-dGTP pyrophosphatase MutT (NUDIX family)